MVSGPTPTTCRATQTANSSPHQAHTHRDRGNLRAVGSRQTLALRGTGQCVSGRVAYCVCLYYSSVIRVCVCLCVRTSEKPLLLRACSRALSLDRGLPRRSTRCEPAVVMALVLYVVVCCVCKEPSAIRLIREPSSPLHKHLLIALRAPRRVYGRPGECLLCSLDGIEPCVFL